MIECYNLPTARIFTGMFSKVEGNSFGAETAVNNIVMFDKKMSLSDGTFGIIRYIQISSTSLPIIPPHNSKLTIEGENYKILNPRRCDNPAFVAFWESEIQRTT